MSQSFYTPIWWSAGKPEYSIRLDNTKTRQDALVLLHNASKNIFGEFVPIPSILESIRSEMIIENRSWGARIEYSGPQVWVLTWFILSGSPVTVHSQSKVYLTLKKGLDALEKKVNAWREIDSEYMEKSVEDGLVGYANEYATKTVYLERIIPK